MKARALPVVVLVAAAFAAPPSTRAQSDDELARVQAALSAGRVEEAERLLSPLAHKHPRDPAVLFQRSMLAFHLGSYTEATNLSAQAIELSSGSAPTRWHDLHELQAATRDATEPMRETWSDDGRFAVYYSDVDQVMVPYALEVLRDADRSISRALDTRVPGPIRLEIYEAPDDLARVSALTVEQIKRTGTVALSKWNRLMITSPRALVRGYPWADTVAHELVHLLLSRASHDRAPVWLQEGTAKFLERHWRSNDARMRLEPSALGLLQRAHRDAELLPFDRLHPSIAMLPSQDDAALAFAQVATFVERYVERFGTTTLQAAIANIARGTDAREALARRAGVAWSELERDWQKHLPADPEEDPPRHLERRFRSGQGKVDETRDIAAQAAKRFLRLGDLLWDHGRAKAASIEYAKALEQAPDDPIVASRLARAALEVGDAPASISAAQRIVARYPNHAPGRAVLGAAYVVQGEHERAREQLREAILINPFDPEPHCNLAKIAQDATAVAREREVCQTLAPR